MESEQPLAYPNNSIIHSEPATALRFFLTEAGGTHNIFRVAETQVSFNDSYILHDIKTFVRRNEENLLIQNPIYNYNLRRCTSFLASKHLLGKLKKNKDYNKEDVRFARRGMVKFYDLLSDYLADDYVVPSFDNRANHIFHLIQEAYKRGNVIELFSLRKANGESAQVSYCSLLDAWIVGSKNVSICIRSRADIKDYTQ